LFKVRYCRVKGYTDNLWNSSGKQDIFTIEEKELKMAIDHILEKYGEFYQDEGFKRDFLSPGKKYSTITLKNLVDVLRQFKYHNGLEFSELELNEESVIAIKKNRLNYFYNHRLEESESKKLYVSKMFSLIKQFFKEKIGKLSKKDMLVFSGHDNNIADVLSNILDTQFLRDIIFKAPNSRKDYYFVVPPLASSILIELLELKTTNQNFIRVYYNGEEISRHFAHQVSYDDDLKVLSYNDFEQLLDSRISDELDSLDCSREKLSLI
jgi:hypothetical protein